MEVGEWIDFEELEHDIDAVTYRKHSKHDPADLVVDYGEYNQAYSPMDGDGLEPKYREIEAVREQLDSGEIDEQQARTELNSIVIAGISIADDVEVRRSDR